MSTNVGIVSVRGTRPADDDPVRAAVCALQRALGIGVDGDPGPLTLAYLASWRRSRGMADEQQ